MNRFFSSCLAALVAGLFFLTPGYAVGPAAVVLLPHRAIYEISLVPGQGRNGIISASGELNYEFTGSACEGYATKTTFDTALQGQDGKTLSSTMRTTSFESGDGKEFRFVTINLSNGKAQGAADGVARKNEDGVLAVALTQPKNETVTLGKNILLPAAHALALLQAAKEGQTVVQADLYDGSESGRKLYATTAIIGKAAEEPVPSGHPTAIAKFAKTPRYPISLSFYDKVPEKSGEQLSLYDLHAVMFDNGITYKMRLDYPEFSLEARMTSLEVLPAGSCP